MIVCPKCQTKNNPVGALGNFCVKCGSRLQAAPPPRDTGSAGSAPRPMRSSVGPAASAPANSNHRQTAKCAKLLPPEYQAAFPVLTQVFEKASYAWMVLSPLAWALQNKHYVVGYHAQERTLYVFRLPLGLLGVGPSRGVEQFVISDPEEVEYRPHLLTATLAIHRPGRTKLALFVPMPSKRNAKLIYDSIRANP